VSVRYVQALVEVPDQFSVWADDITKAPGLVQGDFAAVVYLDGGVAEGVPVVITEIPNAAGEYRVAWTPTCAGYWEVEICYPVGRAVWKGRYDVTSPVLTATSRPPGYA